MIIPKLLMDLFLFLSVDDGSIIDVNFTDFVYHAPEGFQKIMFEKNLLWSILWKLGFFNN